jgi:hypothetical protein
MVSLQLATLFNDVIGLVNAWILPASTLPRRTTETPVSLTALKPMDQLPLWFSKSFLFSTTAYIQDLFELVKLAQSTSHSSKLTSTKKVRPRPISAGPLKDFVELNSWQRLSPMRSLSPIMDSPWSNSKSSQIDMGSKTAIKDKLVDCFFHQHNELQQLCETTIDQVIKNFARSTLKSCIRLMFTEKATEYEDFFNRTPAMDLNEYIDLLQSLDVSVNLKAREEMNNEFGRIIRGTLELLSPPDTQTKVREIASSLALQHASDKGDQVIRSFIREEKRQLIAEFTRKESKVNAGVPLNAAAHKKLEVMKLPDKKAEIKKTSSPEADFMSLVGLTTLLTNFDAMDVQDSLMFEQLDLAIEDVCDHLRKYSIGSSLPPCVQQFKLQILSSLNKCITSEQPTSALLFGVLKATRIIGLLNKMGYMDSATASEYKLIIQDQTKLKKLTVDISINYDMHSSALLDDNIVGTFLFHLIEGSLVGQTLLEDALIKILKDEDDTQYTKRVVEVMLNNLAINLGFVSWGDDGFVIMIRLQKMLS